MSGGGGGTNTVQKADPYIGQQPYLKDLYAESQRLYRQGPMEFFPAQTFANPTETQLQAENLARLTALGGQSTLAGAAVPAMQFQLAGPANLQNNPYLAGATEAALRPLFSQTQNLLQQARRDANQAGQLGGDRQAILEQGVISDYLTKAGDITSNIYSQAYDNALRTQTGALSQLPTVLGSIITPSQTLGRVGAIEQARQQQAIDDARARFEFAQRAPQAALTDYARISGQNILPGVTSTSQTAQGGVINPIGAALGGAAGYAAGTGTFGSLAGLGSIGGPAGLIGGAIIGGLLS